MIKTRIRKIWGDVLSRKGRTALVTTAILIGVFGAATLVSLNDLLISQLREDLNPDFVAHTHAYVDLPVGQASLEDNQAFVERLENHPDLAGVERVGGQAINFVAWKPLDAAPDDEFNRSAMLTYTEAFGDIQLEPPTLNEGRFPDVGVDEIAVDQRFADAYGLTIGDQMIFLQVGDGGVQQTEPYAIVGTVFQSYFTIASLFGGGSNIPPEEMIFANYADAQEIIGFNGLSSVYVRYTDYEVARAGENALSQAVINDPELSYGTLGAWFDNPDDSFILGQVESVTTVLNMLAIISMIVSGFLVVNVINTIVVEQKQQIGVMKSIGATRFDNVFIYAGMAFVYGVVGTVVGVLLAIPVAGLMAQELAPFALTYIADFRVSMTGVLVGVGMGLLVPILAALIPVFNGTRVTILEAISDVGISSTWGKSRFSRFVGSLPLPINIRQALSNVVQKKGRLALTGVTLMLAAAAFMGVTAVFASIGDTLEEIFDKFNYEVIVVPQGAVSQDALVGVLSAVDGVENVYSGIAGAQVGLEGYASIEPFNEGSNQVFGIGTDPSQNELDFSYDDGTGWSEDPTREGVVITRSLADAIDKGAGDTVVLTIGGQVYEYEVIGVDSFTFQDLIYFDWRDLAVKANRVDEAGMPLPSSFTVDLTGERGIVETNAVIEVLRDDLRASGIEADFGNQPETEDEIAQQLNVFSMIFNLTSAVMAAVGAIGLLATLSMAVFERQKEIGVMRSIGAGSGTIIVQFLVEGVLVGVLAWLVAVPLSYFLALGLSGALGFGDTFTFSYPPEVLVMGLVGIIVIATIASMWPSLSAARSTISDILRYQ